MYSSICAPESGTHVKHIAHFVGTIARTGLEDICDKPIRIQSYCAVARLHGV
jgi:hypothetical protein